MLKDKKYLKIIIGLLIGVALSATTVYATHAVFSAHQITYNTKFKFVLSSTDLQEAIDELFYKSTNCKKTKENSPYFAFGEPTTSSTQDYTTVGKNIFVAKNGDVKSLCYIKNSHLNCYDNNNYVIEKEHLKYFFGSSNCTEDDDHTYCQDDTYKCDFYNTGYISCSDLDSIYGCDITDNNDVSCDSVG